MHTHLDNIEAPAINTPEAQKLLSSLSQEQALELFYLIEQQLGWTSADFIENELWDLLTAAMSNTKGYLKNKERSGLFYLCRTLVQFFQKLEEFRDPLIYLDKTPWELEEMKRKRKEILKEIGK